MLVWAASKRVPRDVLRQNLRPLPLSPSPHSLLSWLCSSQQRYLHGHQSSTTSSSSAKPNAAHFQTLGNRSYSTATFPVAAPAEAQATVRLPEYYPPFNISSSRYKDQDIHPLVTPVDPMKVIILDTPESPEQNLKRGNVKTRHELLALFDACLNTGHLVRANLMLSQMSLVPDYKNSLILVNAHNLFLEALFNRAAKPQDLKVFFMWYEDKMRAEFNIAGNASTFAWLFKASLRYDIPHDGHLYLKRYVEQWRLTDNGIGDVLVLPILTNDEVVKIAKICKLKVSELHESHRDLLEQPRFRRPGTQDLPNLKTTATRGSGLAAIQQSLRSLLDPAHMPGQYSISGKDDPSIQTERQKLLEEDAFSSAQARWKTDHEAMAARGVLSVNQPLNSLLWEWHQTFVPLINEELARVRIAEKDEKVAGATERCLYGPFLRLLPPEKIAAIVMVELLKVHNVAAAGGLKTSRAVMHVGNMLEAEYLAQEIQKKQNKALFGHLRNKDQLGEVFKKDKLAWVSTVKYARESISESEIRNILQEWPVTIKAKLGAVLLTMLLHCAKAPVSARGPNDQPVELGIPAFCHTYQYVSGRKLGIIKLDPNLLKRLGSENLQQGILGRLLPMVVEPRNWNSWDDGGYFYTRSKAVRVKASREQSLYVQTASQKGDLNDMFASLDVLGKTAWRINRAVFDVLVEVWNSEEEFGAIPPATKEVILPPEPAPSEDPKVRQAWIHQIKLLQNEARNNHSQRCSINFKLEIARAFLYDRFYFPHNVDFRGRAYPIPPNLNHIGDDLSRGILMFDKGKELGENGLRWLKIHLANLCGFDKVSFDDREAFANQHINDINDSANYPLKGQRWWLKAEDSWQCLATCLALRDACSLEDPRKYVCHIPVAQDGTCNGLQHYAALGGDMMGAEQVNLLPSEKPSDVYTGVADLVKAAIEADAKNDHEMAILLKDLINRKVVKQTVMTNVYGVTFIGAKEQIVNQLKEIPALKDYRYGHPKFSHDIMAAYITNKVFNSVATMFSGANQIQNWLGTCAKRISWSLSPAQMDNSIQDADPTKEEISGASSVEKGVPEQPKESIRVAKPRRRKDGKEGEEASSSAKKKDIHFMTSVVWTTPLRLPVVQPYRHDRVQLVVTNLQNVYITDPSVIDEINSRKQMTAFPPNFIHSLDATHMLMSAKMCSDSGLTFASVHDSFWTHPSDIDQMNIILRDAFIKLHSGDVMTHLKSEFEVRYDGYRYLASISTDSPLAVAVKKLRDNYVKNVLKRPSLGKKSLTILEDLQWERERDRLLKSSDEKEKARGMEMITPSVLAERMDGLDNVIEELPKEDLMGSTAVEDHGVEVETMDAVMGDGPLETIGADEADFSELDEEEEKPERVKKNRKEKLTQNPSRTSIWMPLVFPPLPPKGDFKVEQLKESQYFFS